ncbi:MAG: hypothetical protein ACREEM_19885 [Blastocatellia bacterium]
MMPHDKIPVPSPNESERDTEIKRPSEKTSVQLFVTDDLVPQPEAIYVDLPPWDAQAAIEFLRYLREEDDPEEQRETMEYLIRVLDEDRPSNRKLFPEELKGVTW